MNNTVYLKYSYIIINGADISYEYILLRFSKDISICHLQCKLFILPFMSILYIYFCLIKKVVL